MALDDYKYNCSKCDLSFNIKRNYDKHRKTHQIRKIYTCKVCSIKITNYRNYQRHFHSHTQGTVFECSLCNAEFIKKETAERHLSNSHQIHKIECQVCGKGLSSRSDAIDHLKNQHREVDFSGCTVVDDKNETLKFHFPCDNCGEKFLSKEDLSNHTLQKHDRSGTTYSLRRIVKGAKIKKSLVNELAKKITNRNKKPVLFNCSKCQKKFQTSSQLKRHELVHQSIEEIYEKHRQRNRNNERNGDLKSTKQISAPKVVVQSAKRGKSTLTPVNVTKLNHFICPYCKKIFTHSYNYHRHMKNHNNEQSNKQVFNNLIKTNKMNNFSISVTPVKPKINTVAPLPVNSVEIYPEVFDIVGKTSPVKKNNTTQSSASGDTFFTMGDEESDEIVKKMPFQCKICKMRFIAKEEMTSHVSAKHFNKCKYCDRIFSEKKYLQAHMRGAHSDKMFACAHCDKIFVQSFHLDQHVRFVHNKAPQKNVMGAGNHQCPKCKKFFSNASGLKRHRILIHDESL